MIKFPVFVSFQGQAVAVVHCLEGLINAANDHFGCQNYRTVEVIDWHPTAWIGEVTLNNGDIFGVEHVAIYGPVSAS